MSSSKIDKLIAELEKAEIRTQLNKIGSSGPPSLPTAENGHIGIWRYVRGRRMFIELEGPEIAGVTSDVLSRMSDSQKTARFGRYFDEEGRVKEQFRSRLQQGKVLEGPGDLKGHPIGDVPSDAWSKLNPESLQAEFGKFKGDSKRLASLRSAVEASGATLDEKGKEALNSDDPVKVANVGINSGMSIDDVKSALGGSVSRIGEKDAPKKPFDQADPSNLPSNVVPFERPKRLKSKYNRPGDKANGKEENRPNLPPAEPDKPKTSNDTEDDSGPTPDFDGSLALALDPGSVDSSKEEFDNILGQIEDAAKDAPLKKLIQEVRSDLANDRITPKEAQEKIYDSAVARLEALQSVGAANGDTEHEAQRRANAEEEKPSRLNAPPVDKEDVKNDKEAVQTAIKSLQNIEELVQQNLDEAKGDRKKAQELAAKQVIQTLNSHVKSPRIRMEVQRLERSGGRSTRSMMISLIQILRLILTLLIPG